MLLKFRGQTRKKGYIVINGEPAPSEWLYGTAINLRSGKPSEMYDENQRLTLVYNDTLDLFTGLTDLDGKEVYENDIVSFEDETPGQHEYHDSTFMNRGIMKFDNGGFYVAGDIVAATMDDLVYNNKFQGYVIGNIHDNPELIENFDF